jgi:myosin I
LTNSVYKSLQDNNEEQVIIMLGESGAGKTENCRMIVKFLSKISGRFIQRQRSSNSIASYKSLPNSTSSTPKHKSLAPNNNSVVQNEKSSCFRSENRNKKISRVEFDFSYQMCNENETLKYCPRHNCSQTSTNTSNTIEVTKQKNSARPIDFPTTSKSFTSYETINQARNAIKVPNNISHKQMQNKCDSLDFINESTRMTNVKPNDVMKTLDDNVYSSKETNFVQNNSHLSYNKIDLDRFKKSAKKKVPTKLNNQLNICLEIQSMKERIAQAEFFLEAMGGASMMQNRDSSRYVLKTI